MKKPFRVVFTPAFIYVADAEGTRIASASADKTMSEVEMEARAKLIVRALNRLNTVMVEGVK